jgi:hypothetical protein
MTYKPYIPLTEKKDRCGNCTGKMSYDFGPTNEEEFTTHCKCCGEPLLLPEKIKGR